MIWTARARFFPWRATLTLGQAGGTDLVSRLIEENLGRLLVAFQRLGRKVGIGVSLLNIGQLLQIIQ